MKVLSAFALIDTGFKSHIVSLGNLAVLVYHLSEEGIS